jgi:hypothetical protein
MPVSSVLGQFEVFLYSICKPSDKTSERKNMNRRKPMNRKNAGLLAFMMAFALFALCWTPVSVKGAAGGTLKVKLNYTGTEEVDDTHKIYVLVFDADPYTQETFNPKSSQTATAKDETTTFSDLNFSPVYVYAFYDKSGTGNPESGSPAGAYGKELGKAEPIKIEEGKTVEITLAFDDSFTVP